ncbi:MAG: hypothetical protein IPK94_09000 [Saprospiraceae bacterium]|nr:hypothetical protein [Saprospiraceae bacterium]
MLIWYLYSMKPGISTSGKTPLIFFDEFDTAYNSKALGWIQYFLAPMQDGVFKDGEKLHPLGKAIFVFAGGTGIHMKHLLSL